MSLTKSQFNHLRRLAHPLKPIVTIASKGITENILEEIKKSLAHHELIKIKILAENKTQRKVFIEKIRLESDSSLIQHIGQIAVLFIHKKKDAKIKLPK